MDVFALRHALIKDYATYIRSFIQIQDQRIAEAVAKELNEGLLWPDPLIQLNPAFEAGLTIDALVDQKILHPGCKQIFRLNKNTPGQEKPLQLYQHQEEAIRAARTGHDYVLTTGTGSGKSLSYIIPIVDHVLRVGSGRGIQAIVVYPMNALANSQLGELQKFLNDEQGTDQTPVTFARYTGQESEEDRDRIKADPPDIILTNYVMMELIMTRPSDIKVIAAAKHLKFLVLDELHTYRGRQGADVALLVRRIRKRMGGETLQCVGTSATMLSSGTHAERQQVVADVASRLFGRPVKPEHVIGETLRRATPEQNLEDPTFKKALSDLLNDPKRTPAQTYETFVQDPLSIWIESIFGVRREPESNRLERAQPRSISGPDGAADALSEDTGVDPDHCAEAIQEALLAGYRCEPSPDTGFQPFAFRLHQFISRGDTVYTTLETEADRYITVRGQQFAPGDRERVLLPLAFCRECGQEYYVVRRDTDPALFVSRYTPREVSDQFNDEREGEAGFIYLSTDNPFPEELDELIERLPDDWIELHKNGLRVKRSRRKYLPSSLKIQPDGREGPDGLSGHYISAPFRFCLNCGVTYGTRQRSDFAKLATLSSEGRSTATTILSLSAVRQLRAEASLKPEARKLLSFTDNRQDASLQAGHFNDFVETGMLRGTLYQAVKNAGTSGLAHDELTLKVFDALALPMEEYASDPDVRYLAKDETNKAFRNVLGYRLYRDLKRGWRITTPNLEQCGLLRIEYASLSDLCNDEPLWQDQHAALATARPEIREQIARTLLDYLRRELVIKVDYLDSTFQERIEQQSSQRLIGAWALDENEKMEVASIVFPRPTRPGDFGGHLFLSGRGGFGQYLGRSSTFPNYNESLKTEGRERVILDLFEALRQAGLVEVVSPPKTDNQVPGYQIPATALHWMAGDGTTSFHDPIRMPQTSSEGQSTNSFFVDFYRTVANQLTGLEAREHTAQVEYDLREDREERFKDARLPVLYCSPTMELGVDIAQLNVVNMRNVPPTPANYAQRSGRAGRSGQPALVFTYCTTGSSHDQYFFRRPERMVAGVVAPPRLDLANEDLVRAHLQATWLAISGMSLGKSLQDILDVSGDTPTLALLDWVQAHLDDKTSIQFAAVHAKHVLASFEDELSQSDWYSEGWAEEVMKQIPLSFNRACERWRSLYQSALDQSKTQSKIILDASRPLSDKRQAERLRREAEEQLKLLTEAGSATRSDFYSYRYFASEGFLPGYNFPRLPLSAYIPGRRKRKDTFLSRSRFLAISEFGPRAIIYHEGSRYIINKVILPVGDDDISTRRAKRCEHCGYLHPVHNKTDGVDLCEYCNEQLGLPYTQLFRLQNVSTKRRDRINSDEEERMRIGYDIITTYRFNYRDGHPTFRTAEVMESNRQLATLTYGHAATLWRINLGWSRRKNPAQIGFALDVERGYWARNEQAIDDPDDPMSEQVQRVVPYVEDRRNCLILDPDDALDVASMPSLQAALKHAIQIVFQLEDGELAVEPLPDRDDRRQLLFYESAEGGAGVLRRLLDEPENLALVARQALELCHFDPDTGEDLQHAHGAREDCEAACYDCLMSYHNQRDHNELDRLAILDTLLLLHDATVNALIASTPRAEHLARLRKATDSSLERKWLDFMDVRALKLPSHAQMLMPDCQTRPDFYYDDALVAVYIDGPPHDYPDRQTRDQVQTDCMEDYGYTVIRFHHEDDWEAKIDEYPHVFGKLT